MKNKDKKTVICLIGPTAVGKTEVAIRLAKKIDGEIISCDSMQVYKGIDVACAKPTQQQRSSCVHYLIDIIRPTQEYNAASFRSSCLKIIKQIHQKAKIPLIVAGTGLYLRAVLDGLFVGPGKRISLRKKLYQQAHRYGVSYLYKRLKRRDPRACLKIHPHDLRRIIRALEVYESTGKPISKLQEKVCGIRNEYALQIFGLHRPRGELYARIEQRVDKMFRQGLVAEIKKLNKGRLSKTAKSLLGYQEITAFLNGEYSAAEARGLLKRNTRRYAKRQLSWFKREKAVKWIDIAIEDTPEVVAEKIIALLPTSIM